MDTSGSTQTKLRRSGAEIIVALLERQGIRVIAGIPGGCNLPLYDALRDSSIRHILSRHEQGAGFMAQGMARTTGRAAVCFATSGPGATNLLTAIADAKLDSIPVVAITGQVPTAMIGTDAFQEVDVYGMTLPITKHNFLARSAAELLEIIPKAFEIAESGRPGPVLIDVPKDVQVQHVEFDVWPEPWNPIPPAPCDSPDIERLAVMIHAAARPILYVGGGVIMSEATHDLIALARKNSIPVACTLAGLGAFPPDDPLYLGMLGMHATRATNMLLDEADLLLAIGVRFDDRATGHAGEFCRHANIAHIDIDASEIDKIKPSNLSVVGDAGAVLRALTPRVNADSRPEWMERVTELKHHSSLPKPKTDDPLQPVNFIRHIAAIAGPDTIICTDVGQHQMWTAQAYPFQKPRTLLTSGGLGTMGFGLPAAIGAALANPDKRIVCISGDGSILMNIQELATLAELGLNVTVIIMNNQHLGLVRQQQELFYNKRYFASKFDLGPNFVAIAEGFNVPAYELDGSADPVATLKEAISAPGPALVNTRPPRRKRPTHGPARTRQP